MNRVTDGQMPSEQMAPHQSVAQVIGVVGDVVSGLLRDGVDITSVYFPIGPNAPGELSLLLRSRTTLAAGRAAFEDAVNTLDGDVACQVIPIEQVLPQG